MTRPGLGDKGMPVRSDQPSRPTQPLPPERADEIGDATVAIAVELGREMMALPRIVRTPQQLQSAPIDHRAGFVLSLIDGHTSVQGIVDLAAMPDGEVLVILERLAALDIVSLPGA